MCSVGPPVVELPAHKKVVVNARMGCVYNDNSFKSGENGIRTRGTVYTAHRFSKPAHSASLPSLLALSTVDVTGAISTLYAVFFTECQRLKP